MSIDEFNKVIAKKSDSFNQRRINFFKKILTKENGGQISYQGKIYPCLMNKKIISDSLLFRISR